MTMRTIGSRVAAIVVLAAATVWAQSTSPASALNPAFAGRSRAGAARRPSIENKVGSAGTAAALHQRMDDMQSTLNKMHALLKHMRAKAASSSSKDSLAKANLDMWELMVGELDKQFDQLRSTTLAREDLDARRAAMYKQASDKADAAAQRARALAASQALAPGSADHGTSAVSGMQPAANAGAGPALPATPASPSATPK